MGFLDFQAAGGAAGSRDAEALAPEACAWSDPAAWNGRVPRPDEDVAIPPGRTVVVDGDVRAASITVFGTLLFAPRELSLHARWILVEGGGALRAGSACTPRDARLTISLGGVAPGENAHGLGTAFLAAVRGGTIDLHGRPRKSWVPLGDFTVVGGRMLRLAQPVDWQAGEPIAIASGGAELPLVEERTIEAVARDGLTVTVDRPLQHRHLGERSPLRAPAPRIQSAVGKVVLMSRSIVVEGDEASVERGFGAHCLIGSGARDGDEGARSSIGRFRGVEFRRVGQFGRRDRFPLHWSANGDSGASCAIDCLIRHSFQRGVVIAGSPHVRLAGNVVYKPYGHAFVIEHAEDAAQTIAANLAVRPRVARFADPALRGLHEHRPRAFWFGPLRAAPPPTIRRPR
jgi:cell migration-inducing and hyaluronan-binding protein